jgi:hypothetical protein
MSGFSVELFVESPSLDLICSVCIGVFNNPKQCKNGHSFCEMCFVNSINHCSRRCPLCRVAVSLRRLTPNETLRAKIANLIVKCNNSNDFVCQKTGKICDFDNHICTHPFIGREVVKYFPGFGSFTGVIVAWNK